MGAQVTTYHIGKGIIKDHISVNDNLAISRHDRSRCRMDEVQLSDSGTPMKLRVLEPEQHAIAHL